MSIVFRLLTACSVTGLTASVLLIAGCSDSPETSESGSGPEVASSGSGSASPIDARTAGSDSPAAAAGTSASTESAPTFYRPVTLGSDSDADASRSGEPGRAGQAAPEEPAGPPPTPEEIMAGLKPIATVLVGEWTSILKNASINQAHHWLWDVRSDPAHPAIVLQIPDGQFFTRARISYEPRRSQFTMTTTGADGQTRSYIGVFEEPPKDVPGDDGRSVERTFKLAFEEQAGEGVKERFRYVIAQQHNNRYLMEIYRARGSAAFRLRDVAGTQRNGVSFARADDDYGDRTCVISGGLGTSTVSFKGRTFYVCCSGCKAAFEDDPETWIAKFDAKKNEKN